MFRDQDSGAGAGAPALPKTQDAPDNTRDPVLEQVLASGASCAFVPTIRYLESLHPSNAGPGQKGPYKQEQIRFTQCPDLSFQAGDLAFVAPETQPGGRGQKFNLQGRFLGLMGANAPTPNFMVEEIAQPGDKVQIQRDFLDMFHHRIYGLLYRGIVSHDIAPQMAQDPAGAWTQRVLALAGCHVQDSHRYLTPQILLRLAPLLATGVASAQTFETALNCALSPHLGDSARCRVHSFRGGFSPLAPSAQLALGGANHALGSMVLGSTIPHRAAKACIEIKTLQAASQANFSRGGEAFGIITELAALMLKNPIQIDLELFVRYQDAEHCRVGYSRLGQNSVLHGDSQSSVRKIRFDAIC